MQYAEVAVGAPVATRDTFTYGVPEGMDVKVGEVVWVPFGPRLLPGVVVELRATSDVSETRDIVSTTEPPLRLSPSQLEMARWLRRRYLCPFFEALRPFMPPGFERKPKEYVQVVSTGRPIPADLESAVQALQRKKVWRIETAERLLGGDRRLVDRLLKLGVLTHKAEPGKAQAKPKTATCFRLAVDADRARQEKMAPKASAVLQLLVSRPELWSADEIRQRCGPSYSAALRLLEKRGLVTRVQMPVLRDPLAHRSFTPQQPLGLSNAQRVAVESIGKALEAPRGLQTNPSVFLLFGVTGSGKTEVYLQALARAVALGKRAIVLVPEISLTPQAVQRFAGRFPGRVAIVHSQLSPGEQYDEWRRIRNGEFDVVIGSRSAIFSPQSDLGLIVVDEEHEPSYKQDDSPCCYHAREAAIERAAIEGAVVVLGSATPDTATFFAARQGRYRLISLPERVSAGGYRPLARVSVVDMRAELKAGNRSVFSRALSLSLSETLSRGEQAILFLNRRGTNSFVQCRDCGFALRCKSCDTSLTYHEASDRLVCHHCNARRQVPDKCPQCGSPRIKHLGLGTEGLEAAVKAAYPAARVMRWDRDTVSGQRDHEEILERFLAKEADILVGTQMIAKGLDMPGVTLAGVVMADMGLHFPDFRAAERTFQLISQVAGRAGRGPGAGQVIVQTYSPDHYAVVAAARQNYEAFYRQEIFYRKEFRNPPFSQLAKLVFSHGNAARCQAEAERVAGELRQQAIARGFSDIDVIGPAPAFVERLRGQYRWQLVLRGNRPVDLLDGFPLPHGWTVDMEPMSLL